MKLEIYLREVQAARMGCRVTWLLQFHPSFVFSHPPLLPEKYERKGKKGGGVKIDDSRIKRFVETNINSTTNKKIGKITNDYKSNKN